MSKNSDLNLFLVKINFIINLERIDGTSPSSSAWKAEALILCYTRKL